MSTETVRVRLKRWMDRLSVDLTDVAKGTGIPEVTLRHFMSGTSLDAKQFGKITAWLKIAEAAPVTAMSPRAPKERKPRAAKSGAGGMQTTVKTHPATSSANVPTPALAESPGRSNEEAIMTALANLVTRLEAQEQATAALNRRVDTLIGRQQAAATGADERLRRLEADLPYGGKGDGAAQVKIEGLKELVRKEVRSFYQKMSRC